MPVFTYTQENMEIQPIKTR